MANIPNEDIPIGKIKQNIEAQKQKRTPEQLQTTIFAVLVSTGSMFAFDLEMMVQV